MKPVKVKVSTPKNYQMDYKRANKKAGLNEHSDPIITNSSKPPKGYTWYHHQDGETMMLVKRGVHREFTHIGGASIAQKRSK